MNNNFERAFMFKARVHVFTIMNNDFKRAFMFKARVRVFTSQTSISIPDKTGTESQGALGENKKRAHSSC